MAAVRAVTARQPMMLCQLLPRLIISRNLAVPRLQKKNNKPKPKKPAKTKRQKELRAEGHKIYDVYFEQARAITQAWTEERLAAEKEALDIEGKAQRELALERERDREIIEEINRENARIARKRKMLLYNKEKWLQKLQQRKEERLELKNLRLLERRAAIVREAIEASKNFVTLQNLEEKINECLESEVNYNFALTPSGEKVLSTKPPGNFGDAWTFPGPVAYEVTQSRPVGGEWDWVFDKRKREPTTTTTTTEEGAESWQDLLDVGLLEDVGGEEATTVAEVVDVAERPVVDDDFAADILDEVRDEVPEDGVEKRDELLDILEDQVEAPDEAVDEVWDSLREEEIKALKHKTGEVSELDDLLEGDLGLEESKEEATAKGKDDFMDILRDDGEKVDVGIETQKGRFGILDTTKKVSDDFDEEGSKAEAKGGGLLDFMKDAKEGESKNGSAAEKESKSAKKKSSKKDDLLDFLKSEEKSDKEK